METWNLRGSKVRDEWRYQHKQKLGKGYHGMDGDFFLIDFEAGIVAYLDLKYGDDNLTDTEKTGYQDFIDKGIPVYIVDIQNVETGYCYLLSYPNMEYFRTIKNWDEFADWERELRRDARS